MAVWDQLKVVLIQLRDEQPGVLLGYPMPEVDEGRQPRFRIHLAPWAAATAQLLDEQFGDSLDLTVGALPYPPDQRPAHSLDHLTRLLPGTLLTGEEAEIRLDGQAVVRSGQTLHHGLLVHNLTGEVLPIATNGQVTAVVVDPRSGEIVGGFSGAQFLPLIRFNVAPGATERIPLLIGTASFRLSLGYTVPPGEWGIQASLDPGRDRAPAPSGVVRYGEQAQPAREYRLTPVLPLTITA